LIYFELAKKHRNIYFFEMVWKGKWTYRYYFTEGCTPTWTELAYQQAGSFIFGFFWGKNKKREWKAEWVPKLKKMCFFWIYL